MSLIGSHVSIAGGLEKAIKRGDELGCEAIQIFTGNQLQWKRRILSEPRAEQFRIAWSSSSVKQVIVHCSYLVNLAAEGSLGQKSVEAMVTEINICDRLGIDDIVVHPGHKGELPFRKASENVSRALQEIIKRTEHARVRINLETMAGEGTVIGSTLDELALIADKVLDDERIGICLDTAHLHAAGYDLRTLNAYSRFKSRLLSMFEVRNIACWHLNDTYREIGSRIDRHENIGEGKLGLNSFGFILNDAEWDDIPAILETPKGQGKDDKNLSLLRKLRGG